MVGVDPGLAGPFNCFTLYTRSRSNLIDPFGLHWTTEKVTCDQALFPRKRSQVTAKIGAHRYIGIRRHERCSRTEMRTLYKDTDIVCLYI